MGCASSSTTKTTSTVLKSDNNFHNLYNHQCEILSCNNTKSTKKLSKESRHTKAQKVKIVLLGAGDAGKSTIFKQSVHLYGKGFTERERMGYTPIIYSNLVDSMKILLNKADLLCGCHMKERDPAIQKAAFFVKNLPDDARVNRVVAGYMKALWSDHGIRHTYAMRGCFQLHEQCAYFFENLDRIADDQYMPSNDDILRARARTTGISEAEFCVSNTPFQLIDIGGQRSERRKWKHVFNNVTAIVFVAAISEYDQVLAEDDSTNRVMDSIDLFSHVCHDRQLSKIHTLLFLNKSDLFRQKLCPPPGQAGVPLQQFFPDYTGGADFDAGIAFMRNKFLAVNPDQQRDIYVHVTCATDTQHMKEILDTVTSLILLKNVRQMGLM